SLLLLVLVLVPLAALAAAAALTGFTRTSAFLRAHLLAPSAFRSHLALTFLRRRLAALHTTRPRRLETILPAALLTLELARRPLGADPRTALNVASRALFDRTAPRGLAVTLDPLPLGGT